MMSRRRRKTEIEKTNSFHENFYWSIIFCIRKKRYFPNVFFSIAHIPFVPPKAQICYWRSYVAVNSYKAIYLFYTETALSCC
jgi:hypothetical protein